MLYNTLELKDYILNENNMSNYLKYKLRTQENNEKKVENKKRTAKCDGLFIPNEKDTLFWCYYIMANGEAGYEMLHTRNDVIAKQLKIDLVSKVRDNKSMLKIYKFDTLTNIESNLANDPFITVKTFISLCMISNLNVIFVNKKTYFELLTNDVNPIYVIRNSDIQSKYQSKYGFEIADDNLLKNIKELYKLESLDKPVKSLSSYKLQDLIDLCNKLALETTKKDTGKKKTKNELYESIIQYF